MDSYFLYSKEIVCLDTGEVCIGYKNYLNSKHWNKLRIKYIHPNTPCTMCQATGVVLNLHHITYENLGKEKSTDLVVLCTNCHRIIHKELNITKVNETLVKMKSSNKSTRKQNKKGKKKKFKPDPYIDYSVSKKISPGAIKSANKYKKKHK